MCDFSVSLGDHANVLPWWEEKRDETIDMASLNCVDPFNVWDENRFLRRNLFSRENWFARRFCRTSSRESVRRYRFLVQASKRESQDVNHNFEYHFCHLKNWIFDCSIFELFSLSLENPWTSDTSSSKSTEIIEEVVNPGAVRGRRDAMRRRGNPNLLPYALLLGAL